ncbi:hypothetical protein L195_g064326, partial [Trifolium pratense]
ALSLAIAVAGDRIEIISIKFSTNDH